MVTLNENRDFVVTETVGGFSHGRNKNTFDAIYQESYDNLLANNINIVSDITSMVKKPAVINALKDKLLGTLVKECTEMREAEAAGEREFGTHALLDEQIGTMFDNCVDDLLKESTRVGNLLPIKAVDFPILIKQQLKLATKDIMQTEVTKSPIVKKHIEQTWIVDNSEPDPRKRKRYKYPQCFFTDEFKEIFDAGKGYKIKSDTVMLSDLYNYDVVSNLTDAPKPSMETGFTFDLQIPVLVLEDGTEIKLEQPMRINLSDNMWLGGKIDKTVVNTSGEEVEVHDIVTGMVDFVTHTVSLTALNGQIKGVKFSGYLSNEKNVRNVGFDYTREEREWKIEDGMRATAQYSLEQLEDTKALLDIDLYQKTYNNLSEFLTQMEDSKILEWLDQEFERYDGIEVNPLDWVPFISKRNFDFDSSTLTTALPSQYINEMLKFAIDGFIIDICDKAKLENMTFVIYGNPRYIRMLDPKVNWVTRPGSSENGVTLDYGYGIMTSGDVKVQVVSTKKVNASYDSDEMTHAGLRFIPYPLSDEQMTFKHYKWTSHIMTAANSAYRPNAEEYPGGAQTYLVGVSRYTNASVQGIQAQMKFTNAEPYISID